MNLIPVVLTIAGSDSGGGAGIQADLKTFAFHKVHGATALTCVTAQNTLAVTRVDALPPASVVAQIQAVKSDLKIQALKTGMLLNAEIMAAVAQEILDLNIANTVIDPVMVSRTGAKLMDDQAIATMKNQLIPLAAIVTPNRYEAQILAQMPIETEADMQAAAKIIHQLGARAVLIKGGAMENQFKAIDVWFDGDRLETLKTQTIDTKNTHGTGCTLSAAIAAHLALGNSAHTAAIQAKNYVTNALKYNLAIGAGAGPIGHAYSLFTPAI